MHAPQGQRFQGSDHDVATADLKLAIDAKAVPPLRGALLKNRQDVHLLGRLVFMARTKR